MTDPIEPAPHRRWRLVLLVAVGGAIGTAVRAVLAAAVPDVGGVSWVIFGINVVGAFCLGLLLESLARRGPDLGGRRAVRLFVGTGALGGFTTYSTLALDTASFLDAGRVGVGVGYALLTVVGGLVAVVLGVLAASRGRSRTDGARRTEAADAAQPTDLPRPTDAPLPTDAARPTDAPDRGEA